MDASAKTVLIVGDNELNMKLFHDLLDAHGYRILQTKDGMEALDIAREHRPGLKVICISGYTEDALRQRIPSDPSTQFLPKPFGLKQLAELVKQMLDAPVAVA